MFLTKLPTSDFYLSTLFQFTLIASASAAIWFFGPLLTLGDFIPLAQPDQRFYVIALILMLGMLKFFIVDLDRPNPYQYRDAQIRQKLVALQNRFRGALQFLRKTTVTRHGKQIQLNELPWFLLIGPTQSGKTSLLANSKVNFILQRQFQPEQIKNIESSDQCDWWVTREACIIDVPGKYLSPVQLIKNREEKITLPAIFWKFFLHLAKKLRGGNAISGVIITLPLPEIMKHADLKKYQTQVKHIFQRIHELQKHFPQPIPCQLIITKCDLLPGFNEFFNETSDDELTQNWGVVLPYPKSSEKVHDLFLHRFNALIKKLNQQLLFRLHQERNPMARPYIKDFPLQIERVKEFILDFIKHFSASQVRLTLQGVHLTSSLQQPGEEESNVIETPNTTQRAIQLFQEPKATSRAYFIKQLLSDALTINLESPQKKAALRWKRRIAYAMSITTIAIACLMLGKDFQQGINQTYSIQKILSDYQLALPQTQDPDEHLMRTVSFLNSLQQAARHPDFKLDLLHMVTFYSHRSQQKATVIYSQALQNILLPEVRNYLGEYLRNPVNKTPETIYNTLKAYLMLGESGRLQADYITSSLKDITPKTMEKQDAFNLVHHVNLALSITNKPLPLDPMLVQETRNYLASLPGFQLSYVILKNSNNNSAETEINLGTTTNGKSAFTMHQVLNQVPVMFTAKSFTPIMQNQAEVAAQEALLGNWVLGNNATSNKTPEMLANLTQQLRGTYISNYIDAWESLLANIRLTPSKSLAETDTMIVNLMSTDSPLLQLLQTLHDNTYFDPIVSNSPKLQSLGQLVDKNNQTENTLYQAMQALQNLHQYLQPVISAENPRKAAFNLVATRMQRSNNTVDPITHLRLIAEKSPEPVRTWLDKITDDTWKYLLKDASHYIDTSWQEQVSHSYLADIANRYPFNPHSKKEVDLKKFIHFFGNPGVVISFYNHYLAPFVDTSTKNEMHWKTIDNQKVPFSEDVLHQIQEAMKIHMAFFPNRDNKLFVQFSLQPYRLDKNVRSVRFNINEKQFSDSKASSNNPHVITWPNKLEAKMTMVQFNMQDDQIIYRQYPGAWGWFRLVNQSFEPMAAKKSLLINVSNNNPTVKYLLYTRALHNPFANTNLQQFKLNQQLA